MSASVARPAVIASTFWPNVELCTTARSIVEQAFQMSSRHTRADRHVAARQRLGDGDEVGDARRVLEREERAGAAEAGLHLVDREERAVVVTQLGRGAEVAVGRDEHALALDRLDDERGDVARLGSSRAQRVEVAERHRRAAGEQLAEAIAELLAAVERERAGGQAVERVVGEEHA